MLIDTLRNREKTHTFIETMRRGNVGQAIGEVVKSAPEIVNCVTRDERDGLGNRLHADHPVDGLSLISPLRIVMGLDYVRIRTGIEKSALGEIEVLDMLLGPFNFVPDLVDPSHIG